MLGIGHRKGVRVFAKLCSENATGEQKVVLAALCALGTEGAVPDASIRVLEKFICLLYRVKDDTLDHARPIMLRKKNGRPSTFMSTSDSFHSRCLRAFYQVCVCVCVPVLQLLLANPRTYGVFAQRASNHPECRRSNLAVVSHLTQCC